MRSFVSDSPEKVTLLATCHFLHKFDHIPWANIFVVIVQAVCEYPAQVLVCLLYLNIEPDDFNHIVLQLLEPNFRERPVLMTSFSSFYQNHRNSMSEADEPTQGELSVQQR